MSAAKNFTLYVTEPISAVESTASEMKEVLIPFISSELIWNFLSQFTMFLSSFMIPGCLQPAFPGQCFWWFLLYCVFIKTAIIMRFCFSCRLPPHPFVRNLLAPHKSLCIANFLYKKIFFFKRSSLTLFLHKFKSGNSISVSVEQD